MALTTDGDVGFAPVAREGGLREWRWWLGVVGLWTLAGVLTAHYWYARASFDPDPPPLSVVYRLALQGAWQWALFTPIVVWLARVVPVDRPPWSARVAFHLAAAALFALADPALDRLAFPLLTGVPAASYGGVFVGQVQTNIFSYLLVLAVAHGIGYYRRLRERQLEAIRMEAQLSRAQLQVLKMQLQPHFLFNTLSAVSTLALRGQSEAVVKTLGNLGDLLRYSLDDPPMQEVPLRMEISFLERYLAIQRERFPDRLTVRYEVEPRALDALVPTMLMQPLVENAVLHGISAQRGPGRVEIRAMLIDGEWLRLEVRDTGMGFRQKSAGAVREGIGLRNTRARLGQLYGDAHRLELGDAPEGGALVAVVVPYRVAQTAPAR